MADSCLIMRNLVDDGTGLNADATTTFCTEPYPINKSVEWSLKFIKVGVTGDPILTIEASNDKVTWCNPYLELDGVTPLTFTLDQVAQTAFDDIFPFKYIRVCGIPNGTTTGTIEIQYVAVQDN